MTGPNPQEPDWESFYRDYRKPGFIPGYEILNKLGGGAFGIVFKARKESIGKDYAVKFLKLDEPGVRGAVMREIDGVGLFAQVDHPNLVSIEDKGNVHGIPFILMGYAGEDTLRTRLQAGPMDRVTALHLVIQVARGLQALHDHSLVHFDLKPENVFLRGDVARIGDYGLSKLVSASHNSLSFGRGTPYYMAPELLLRHGDARSDIYSLGVILYEALAGDVPFKGDSEWEVLRKHEHEEPAFPATIPPREQAVIARCLRKDPAHRYQSVAEVLSDLQPEPARDPMFASAARPSSPEPAAPPRHRPRRAIPPPVPPPPRRPAAPSPPPRRCRARGGAAIFFAFLVLPLAGGLTLAFTDRSSHSRKARVVQQASVDRAVVRSRFDSLPWPMSANGGVIRQVEDTFSRLRSRRISKSSAAKRLRRHQREAMIFGANELVRLDYLSRQDATYCKDLQYVLGKIGGYCFSHRTSRGKDIPIGIARHNVNTAERFWMHVRQRFQPR